jgi:hypothetical protein
MAISEMLIIEIFTCVSSRGVEGLEIESMIATRRTFGIIIGVTLRSIQRLTFKGFGEPLATPVDNPLPCSVDAPVVAGRHEMQILS